MHYDKTLDAMEGTWCESHTMALAVCILNPSNGTHSCRPGGGLAGFESLRQRTALRMRLPDGIHNLRAAPEGASYIVFGSEDFLLEAWVHMVWMVRVRIQRPQTLPT